jgi:hypothetical protein
MRLRALGLFPHEQRLLDLIGRCRATACCFRATGTSAPFTAARVARRTDHRADLQRPDPAWAKANEPGRTARRLVRVNHYALIDIDWTDRTRR